MNIRVDEKNLQSGVLALVVAVVEILHELLGKQAMRRMSSGSLSETESERLGSALQAMERVIADLKVEQGIQEAVGQIRTGLDQVVDRMIDLESLEGNLSRGEVQCR
ncbi:MAG: gas vesicle protein K [Cyanobacteria bacterium NC_groundwater_1444_Ag_S-0.65um_54_12]|nr:gas vesicle protein K [Cyanobacteria bacterium NC_groundwater_1444_Ag_S-0.65um_54_12]